MFLQGFTLNLEEAIKYINGEEYDGDIKTVKKQIAIKTRKLYDVANVLNAVGLTKRLDKNKFQWIASKEITMNCFNKI